MISALILAAGSSSRFGAGNKLLQDLGGRPVISYPIAAASGAALEEIAVILGHDSQAVRDVLPDHVRMIHNPDHSSGMSTSLVAGIAGLSQDCEAVVILVGDIPDVTSNHIDRVIAVFRTEDVTAVRVSYRGTQGHPVLISRELFPKIAELTGDRGARDLLNEVDGVFELEFGEVAPMDVDTPEDLAVVRARLI